MTDLTLLNRKDLYVLSCYDKYLQEHDHVM